MNGENKREIAWAELFDWLHRKQTSGVGIHRQVAKTRQERERQDHKPDRRVYKILAAFSRFSLCGLGDPWRLGVNTFEKMLETRGNGTAAGKFELS